ncbi:unnamed protein product [Owenia fusiformis]|uniref:Spectrin beta chain n=1 Tax=Owenia fusiformis TaxID=6347 RepID=A0A8S4PGS5_OWEFU|nr:unnamed protein product [Owenia fusiformis]
MTEVEQISSGIRWDPNNQQDNGQMLIEDDEWEGGDSTSKLFERSRIKALADERESVQKKTFCKWVNSHLARVGARIHDLYVDLRDGRMLIKLLEVLSGERLPKPTKGKMRIHCLENVDKSLSFLYDQRVHLENMGAHDIVDGNPRLTLGLIWTIILRFQIQDITIEETDTSETRSAKDALLLWCQMKTAGYSNVNIRNFTTSWRDGLAFNAIIHKHRPDLIKYEKLQKSNAMYNLNNAFDVAEDKLGLTKLLDAEDVNVDFPDEKSVITYVVTYYHYFSKMKADSVQGRRIGKVIGNAIDNDSLINEYETLTSDLLEWIEQTIQVLNDREFANSLNGVQQQLTSFNTYRTVEKPPKFVEKGNLEIQLFTLQSKMRANNQKPYFPGEGKMISDINKAWEKLEKSEHERELALREELIRQEKLEQLAARFDRKAGMRETWLSENQRLVSQDNFGYDLAAVEAATRKHEAIETDINAYEERVQAVVAVANELQQENYHDIVRITARKDNVLRLWNYLLELLRARRMRLEMSLNLQKVFQEMLYVLDWMDEIKTRLLSEDYGKHLMGVEDLLQKHALLEADINVVGERVKTVNGQAKRYVDGEVDEEDYKPCDPQIVQDRMSSLEAAYEELQQLAAERRARLEESRKLWQFYWDMADEEGWIKEKEQIMSSPDLGHDLTSVNLLVNKNKAMEDEMTSRHTHLQTVTQVGTDLIGAGNFGADRIQGRIDEVNTQWDALIELSGYRKKRLAEAVDFYQFFADADDVDTWMMDTFRLVSSEDVGRDEASVQSFLKKHKDVTEELNNYQSVITALNEQAQNLGETDRDSPEVQGRLGGIDRRYQELLSLATLRKQRLLDALSLYKLFNEADDVEHWMREKEKVLDTMEPSDDIEDCEVLRQRFLTLDQEMSANASKVDTVNQLARQLIQVEHPNSDQVLDRQNGLNERWKALQEKIKQKRDELDIAYRNQMFIIECEETTTWIIEKKKLVESTDELGSDLGSVMVLQRRLSGMERDLAAIQSKLDTLNQEADKLEVEKPEEAVKVRQQVTELTVVWAQLKDMLKERDEKLGEAGDLQKFLQDLDHFQSWLSRTQTTIASEDHPSSLAEAEKLLNQHAQLKEEMDQFAPEYARLKEYGSKVIEGQDEDPQYIFLGQRLEALDDGWVEVYQMWESRQNLLSQSLNLQVFLRDSTQAEVLLNQQDHFLSKEEVPQSLEDAENKIKRHEAFITTMDANDEKVNATVAFASRLQDENHFAKDKIQRQSENIVERRNVNRTRAYETLERLKDALTLQQFLQECDELGDWVSDKILASQDETYRDAKNLHSKYVRHQAFESEIQSNKDRLYKLQQDAENLLREKPEMAEQVQPRLDELRRQWEELESHSNEKGEKLFDANRAVIYEQSCDDVDGWINELEKQIIKTEEGHDLTTVNLLIQNQNTIETQMKIKEQQVQELQSQSTKLKELDPGKEQEIESKRVQVEERFQKILGPIQERRTGILRQKRVHQFRRDIEDEQLWIAEKMPQATSTDYGNSLLSNQMLIKKNRSLSNEINGHEPRIDSVCDAGREMIDEGHPRANEFQEQIEDLLNRWDELLAAVEARKKRLELSETAQQYYFDASEAEAWMSEQELYMMGEDRTKDENGANNMLKKHHALEKTVEDYADTVRELGDRSRELIESEHPESDQISVRQSKVDKLYASLKDLSGERRGKLDEILRLFQLNREIDDLEQWIAEREAVAGAHELGQDYEHVCMLRDRFREFARDTQNIGEERVAQANEICDQLIQSGHSDSATIAEWKDQINEAWSDLLELIDTRTQALLASWELFKFYQDCKDTLERIHEKQNAIPEELGRDAQSVKALERKHENFERDLVTLGTQVQQVQEDSAKLVVAYSGDKASEIRQREAEVLNAWRNLQVMCEARKFKLHDTNDLYRFFNMVRDLLLWMDDITRQMNTQEKPRDVSGVELLMNNHQSLKAEVDAREENFAICNNLGKDLLLRKHYRSPEVRDKLISLAMQRGVMMEQWEDGWEHLRLILEVYQFARDASVAESWLMAHEPYLVNSDLGDNLDAVELLIKKHEAFEKSAATQEERFTLLERLTNFELKELDKEQQAIFLSEHPESNAQLDQQKMSRRMRYMPDLPPEEPEKPPTPEPVVEVAAEVAPEEEKPVEAQAEAEELQAAAAAQRGPSGSPEAAAQPGEAPKREKPAKSSTKSLDRKTKAPVEDHVEGILVRKHEWESTAKKASHRSWDKLYAVLHGNSLAFYKDQKRAKADPNSRYHNEPAIDLTGASCMVATGYTKRPHVFRLKLDNGAEYLFQCKDNEEMDSWIRKISAAAGESSGGASPERSQTLPLDTSKKEEHKKKGFFTIKK